MKSLGHVWVPAAGHVEGAVVVHGAEVLRAQGVEDAVVIVTSYSNWRAVGVNQLEFGVVGVGARASVVDEVGIVSAAADVVSIVVVVLDESAGVVEVSTHELASVVGSVRCDEVADTVDGLVRAGNVDTGAGVGVEGSVASGSGDVVGALLVGSVAGGVVRISQVAGLVISLDHQVALLDRDSNGTARLLFLLVISAGATASESKSDVSVVVVAAASPVGPEVVAAIALEYKLESSFAKRFLRCRKRWCRQW